MMEQPTKKFRGRIHQQVPIDEVTAGDIIMFVDVRSYTRSVKSVAKKTVMVHQPKGLKPRAKRVDRESIKEVWRKKVKLNGDSSGGE